jgi:putative pyruvate formate lyase activating enzyme
MAGEMRNSLAGPSRTHGADPFDQLWVWDDPATASALGWYRGVAANRMPAKFRIAATLPVAVPLDERTEDELWVELERLAPRFRERWRAIREGAARLGPRAAGPSLLELCAALARRMLRHCNFCAWECAVDRSAAGKLGACKLAAETRVGTFFHHLGEELVYRGRLGSGTIFFTSCNMRCAFCQNGDISTDKDNGMAVDAATLAAMAWLLRMEGCHNVNWVGGDPAIHLHAIVDAIALLGGAMARPEPAALARALRAKADPFVAAGLMPEAASYDGAFNAPMLWNSNFYLSDRALELLGLLMDVWLPDFKFGPGRCAIELARTPRYWETVTGCLKRIHDAGEDLTIRHLVMPGHVDCCTVPVLDWIAAEMPEVPVNVMDQYRPESFCDPRHPKYQERFAAMARRPETAEIRAAHDHARMRGLRFEAITFEKSRRGAFA